MCNFKYNKYLIFTFINLGTVCIVCIFQSIFKSSVLCFNKTISEVSI